ncbi:MAG: hypothetical protein HQ579_00185 [Candidatus Omnitrophica bacterium]|nr:hypothetical protein [Candidatus Omnitrophota bacterium]
MIFGLFQRKRSDAELGEPIGEITHFFPHVKAGVIKITKGTVSSGDTVYIKGHTTAFEQKIKSMQINRQTVDNAQRGQEIGIKVAKRVRRGDKVYKV